MVVEAGEVCLEGCGERVGGEVWEVDVVEFHGVEGVCLEGRGDGWSEGRDRVSAVGMFISFLFPSPRSPGSNDPPYRRACETLSRPCPPPLELETSPRGSS